jgi:Putative adhesin
MKKKTLTALIVAFAMIHGTSLSLTTRAQEKTPAAGGSVSINNQSGRVQIKLERGSRVAINNRFGRITIMGWDRDTVEATATSDKGAEAVQVEMTADPAAAHSLLSLNVPGRPGQRGPFPFVYVNPNVNISPRIYTTPNSTPLYFPNLNQDEGATPPASAKGAKPATAPARPAQSSKPATAPRPAKVVKPTPTPNDSNVIIVPMPDMSDIPLPAISDTPAAAVGTPPPGQNAPPAAKGGAPRGMGGGAGSGMGGGVGGGFGVAGGKSSDSISLLVKVPRYAQLEPLEVHSGDVNISDIDGPVSISSGSSNLNINRVGSLEVRARSGNINVDGVDGLVYIVATSGTITVRRTKGDVRATSINGNINIHCIKGRVDASNARGGIVLGGVEGDVEASTTDADINFAGAIRPQGRYRLKSMEGRVIMAIPETSPGFTAVLDSYNSDVVTTFPITTETLTGGSMRVNRRIVVKQGDGATQITLDSFGQTVHLVKLGTGATGAPCQ